VITARERSCAVDSRNRALRGEVPVCGGNRNGIKSGLAAASRSANWRGPRLRVRARSHRRSEEAMLTAYRPKNPTSARFLVKAITANWRSD